MHGPGLCWRGSCWPQRGKTCSRPWRLQHTNSGEMNVPAGITDMVKWSRFYSPCVAKPIHQFFFFNVGTNHFHFKSGSTTSWMLKISVRFVGATDILFTRLKSISGLYQRKNIHIVSPKNIPSKLLKNCSLVSSHSLVLNSLRHGRSDRLWLTILDTIRPDLVRPVFHPQTFLQGRKCLLIKTFY